MRPAAHPRIGHVLACLALASPALSACHLALSYSSSAPTDGSRTDRASTDGASTDGASTDGSRMERASTDRALVDGARTDGPTDGQRPEHQDLVAKDKNLCSACVPASWTAVLYNDRSPGAATPCPAGWQVLSPATAMSGLTAPGCTACTCNVPVGRTCTATFECHHNDSCTSQGNCSLSNTINPADGCSDFGCDNSCTHARVVAAAATGGSCTASVSKPLPFSWVAVHDLCVPAVPTAYCQAACLPPAGGFTHVGCVVRGGDQPCPSGFGFAKRQVFYGGASDGRMCKSCTCNPPVGGTCASTVTLFPCTNCTSGVTGPMTVAIGVCTPADQNIGCVGTSVRSATYVGAASPGSCPPSSGGMTGAVTPTAPLTVCCP